MKFLISKVYNLLYYWFWYNNNNTLHIELLATGGDIEAIEQLEVCSTFSDFKFDTTETPDISLEMELDNAEYEDMEREISFGGDMPDIFPHDAADDENLGVNVNVNSEQEKLKFCLRKNKEQGKTRIRANLFLTFSFLSLLLLRNYLAPTGNLPLVFFFNLLLIKNKLINISQQLHQRKIRGNRITGKGN